ncbi:MAG: hypothetical protein L0Y66_17475 [Myxococcaceae bacterium]|nr:hypothetical protein [Myxococcaceae bacterium]
MSERAHLKHASLDLSVLWMTAGSLLLFWLPTFNGFVAGAVGGWRAGHVGRATLAALISTAVATLAQAVGFYVFKVYPNFMWSGMSLWGWAATTLVGLLLGAIPAAIAQRYGGTRELVPVEAERLRRRGRVL